MTNRTKIINANSLHTVESLRRWASCCFSQPVSRMLDTVLEWLTDFLTGVITESRKAVRSRAILTCLLAELNSKVWFRRRRASAVLLSNLIPEFSSSRQKHDVWTSPESSEYTYLKLVACRSQNTARTCDVLGCSRTSAHSFRQYHEWRGHKWAVYVYCYNK